MQKMSPPELSESSRPNPDQLLARIQAEEQEQKRGKLTIFLGYAAGVGKTYAMLEVAHQRQAEGVDLVVGYVETHRRPETEALLANLEIIPRRRIEYRGMPLPELDVDAVLERAPRVALVDELAHTNAPGSRHTKRYQDVEDLLEAGIDVYTTLNIQHLESLNDVVAQITGVTVRETVPDRVVDEVSDIVLIDLPPDELLQRLREGKVYVPEQAAQAILKFFRKGNLTALRELTMRRAAERVDDQMRDYMRVQSIPGPWPAAERLLVCVSPSPLAERLVRSTRRLADELNAEWLAVYIETPEHNRLSQEKVDRISKSLLLAEELGAKTTTLAGESVADTVMNYAHQHNVTKVIAGKPLRSRWKDVLHGSLIDQLIQKSGNIDVYVISSEMEQPVFKGRESLRPHQPYQRYLAALFVVAITTLLSALMLPYLSAENLVIIYLLGVVTASYFLGRGPSLLVSVLSVLTYDFFFVPPYLNFAVSDTQYILTFVGLMVVSLVISQLTADVRDRAVSAQKREADTAALYGLSRDLAAKEKLDAILRVFLEHVAQAFGREVAIFLPDPERKGLLEPYTNSTLFLPDENEKAVAVWAYLHGQPAGRGTNTLTAAEARYLPLKTAQGTVGILGVKPRDQGKPLEPEQRRLLEAFASQAAVAIERAQLAEMARQAQLSQETEKLQTALLNSISHDLRTPLVSITGAISTLRDESTRLDDETRQSLLDTAGEEADRLNRLVGNLLNMSRIEAGAMRIALEPVDVQDLIGSALEQIGVRGKDRMIRIKIAPDLPLVMMDFVLMSQALVNLIDNALKYSPPDTQIEIRADQSGSSLEISVTDRGVGIPDEDLKRVFEKFYRIQRPDQVSGTGLGLSICKGITEAHSGFITAENRPGGGTTIILSIPIEPVLAETAGQEHASRALVPNTVEQR
jgi:two-component system sensor histidine kinase KdpD